MDSSSQSNNKPVLISEKQNPDPNQHPLKCPRCDSSNTKFCYYNNYSLSQPRHFCKACKRYWTRGGTLRNVPVGGGCRKNKRVKRPQPTGSGDGVSSAVTSHVQPSQIDLTSSGVSGTTVNGTLFYNPIELNFPFSGFSSTRVSLDRGGGGRFDLQSQMSNNNNNTSNNGGGGLGFFSGLMANNGVHGQRRSQEFNLAEPAFLGSSTNPSMPSLLVSSLQQPSNGFMGFSQYDQDLRMVRGDQNGGKEVKMEWNNQIHHDQQMNGSDSSSLLWSTNNNNNNVGSWYDPTNNMSSSVPSLI